MTELKLNLGCGINLLPGFINIDKFCDYEAMKAKTGIYAAASTPSDAEFIQADMSKLPFDDNTVDYIESIDAIEHIPFRLVQQTFNEIYRVLKPGGKAHLMTTDFNHLARLWTEFIEGGEFTPEQYYELTQIIYGNQIAAGESHMVPFNPQILKYHLDNAGLEFEMAMYPMGTTEWPPTQAPPPPKDMVLRTDMIWIEAHKPEQDKKTIA